jgi:Abortive infection C-terminus
MSLLGALTGVAFGTISGIALSRAPKFPALVADAQKALGLMVGTLAPDKAGDTSLKMVLDGLYKVAIGINELRNRYGRDHGRGTRCGASPNGTPAWPCTAGPPTAGSCSTPWPTRRRPGGSSWTRDRASPTLTPRAAGPAGTASAPDVAPDEPGCRYSCLQPWNRSPGPPTQSRTLRSPLETTSAPPGCSAT